MVAFYLESRSIDMQVALVIFGWKELKFVDDSDGDITGIPPNHKGSYRNFVPHYSMEKESSRTIFARMRELGYVVKFSKRENTEIWVCSFRKDGEMFEREGSNGSLAICDAALAAFGRPIV